MKHLLFFLFTIFFTLNIEAQDFKSIMKYNIKGIIVNNTLVCPLNGFNHGTIDYGIYKERGFYFAITNDNAKFGNNVLILESVDHKKWSENDIKGLEYSLVELGKSNNVVTKAKFWENEDGTIYLMLITDKVNLTYILATTK